MHVSVCDCVFGLGLYLLNWMSFSLICHAGLTSHISIKYEVEVIGQSLYLLDEKCSFSAILDFLLLIEI